MKNPAGIKKTHFSDPPSVLNNNDLGMQSSQLVLREDN